jgi:hypothetical protein
MKGYELLKKIDDGEIKDGTRIKDDYGDIYIYDDSRGNLLKVEQLIGEDEESKSLCRFTPYQLYRYKFEIIEEPILTDKEREYLKAVIKPFKVTSIRKYEDYENEEYIRVEVEIKDGTYACIEFPDFKKGTRYKGMELDRYYTVEELDLEEN